MPKTFNKEALRILALLKAHASEGISEVSLENELGFGHAQTGRRRRDLHAAHIIECRYVKGPDGSGEWRHFYIREREVFLDAAPINGKLRAQVLASAKGRCSMCGRTITEDGIKLVVDHKVPREWGGKTEPDNLWALCTECNQGKKNHFASFDPAVMQQVMHHASVHVRIGELLKTFGGAPVPSDLIELAANQDDWKKRTRDLRYLGWTIKVSKKKIAGKVKSFYGVERWAPWPPDPSGVIRKFEAARAKRNKANTKGLS